MFRRPLIWEWSKPDELDEVRLEYEDVFPNYFAINRARGAIDWARCETKWDFSGTSDYSRTAFRILTEWGAYPLDVMPRKVLFEDNTIGYTRDDAVPLEEYHPEELE